MNPQFSQPKGAVSKETNKDSIARKFGCKKSEVLYAKTGATLTGYKVIYDKVSQRSYALPSNLPAGATITSLINGILVHSTATVDLGALAVLRGEFVTLVEDFTSGFTINVKNEVVSDGTNTFRWAGTLPKTVTAASTIASTGGVTDAAWVFVKDNTSTYTKIFDTVADAKTYRYFKEGDKVRALFHNVSVVSDWVYTKITPTAGVFNVTAVGGYLVLQTPSFAAAGLKFSDTYNAADAWANRNLVNKLCQDTRFSFIEFGGLGTTWILGSITPNRHYFTLLINKGVKIIGRLEDPSIAASVSNNTGGMFDMVLRENYHTSGDMTNTGVLYNSCIQLEGTVKTVFDASHIQPHNNNCIGYYNAVDCSVVGTGGVEGSDHRGINFDGLCRNGLIDVAFVTNTMDEPLCMDAAVDGYGKVRVGRMYNIPYGGISGLTIGVRCSTGIIDVEIGSFEYNGTVKPVLVSCYNAQQVTANIGYANGITHALRGYETKKLHLIGGRYKNAAYMTGRAGVNTGKTEEIIIEGVKVLDDQVTTGVYCETNQDTFRKITIKDCDFSLCPSTFQYVRGMTAGGKADIVTLENNNSPVVAGWTAQYLNYLVGAYSQTLVTSGATAFNYNYRQPDWNFSGLQMIVAVGGVNYPIELSLVVRSLGSIQYNYTAGAATVVVTISTNTITATVTGGTFVAAYAHN